MGELRAELEAWLRDEATAADLRVDIGEIAAEPGPPGLDDTDQLPVQDPSETGPVLELEPEPKPGAEPEVEPVPVPLPMVEGPAPKNARRKVAPAIAAVAVVVLIVLAVWQFGGIGAGPADDAAPGEVEMLTLPDEAADERFPVAGDGSATGESAELDGEAEAISEPPAAASAGDTAGSGGETGHTAVSEVPPEKSIVAPPLSTGVLEVASLPWARVTLDGRVRGETPLRIDGLAEGEHRLSLTGAVGKKWSGVVTVQGDRSTYYFHNFREDG